MKRPDRVSRMERRGMKGDKWQARTVEVCNDPMPRRCGAADNEKEVR
jgi:hypothetical protein